MDNFKSLSNRGDEVTYDHLYILTRHWKQDIEFYLQDLKFLQRLIGKYSIWIKLSENAEAVNKLSAGLLKLIEEGKALSGEIEQHLNVLKALVSNEQEVKDRENLTSLHITLENEFADFVRNFRNNRQEVFKISEQVMDSENISLS